MISIITNKYFFKRLSNYAINTFDGITLVLEIFDS